MRELPILFSSEMIRAILDGRKSMTRRVCHLNTDNFDWDKNDKNYGPFLQDKYGDSINVKEFCPYQPGDHLYVRETWTKYYYVDENDITHYDQPTIYYAADGEPDFRIVDGDGFEIDDQRIKWRPSIHMPKAAARIWLEVTDVRIERLQEITWKDVEAEGLRPINNPLIYEDKETTFSIYQNDFINLWNDIAYKNDKTRFKTECGKYTWDENPWVWVISFRRIEP